MDNLRELLKEYLELQESLDQSYQLSHASPEHPVFKKSNTEPYKSPWKPSFESKPKLPFKSYAGTASALVAGEKAPYACFYCQQSHWSDTCHVYSTVGMYEYS